MSLWARGLSAGARQADSRSSGRIKRARSRDSADDGVSALGRNMDRVNYCGGASGPGTGVPFGYEPFAWISIGEGIEWIHSHLIMQDGHCVLMRIVIFDR